MRTPALSLLCLLPYVAACELLSGSDPSTWQRVDDRTVPDSLAALYRVDAARLALRVVYDDERPEREEVELPTALVNEIYDALALVYNATGLDSRDWVVERFPIHTFPNPEVFELIVGVDPSKEWVGAWQSGQRFTGNTHIDRLLEAYDLSLEAYYDWSSGHAANLRASTPLNVAALAMRFEAIDGVRNAEPNGWGGDGNDIRARSRGEDWELEYSVGYGDCPAGCIQRHYWTFLVDLGGFVRYEGDRGDPIPEAS